MPDTYLVWSVIITILCCLIPGIIAIIYSSSVSSKYFAGDIEGAKRASRRAQIWCIVSVVAGIIWATLYLPLTLFLG
ncbi:MAG: CD225/dispanin family protein [Muribaculaceae bacterium]|nr:CD225/dispanin family protein [Muribaculaceae bacterium]